MNQYQQSRGGRDSSHIAEIDSDDQRRLNQFFRHELALYNTLIDCFESRTRAFPLKVSQISDKEIAAFAALAERGLQLKDLDQLKESQTLGKDVLPSRAAITPFFQMIIETVLKEKLAVLPGTKKIMIESMCRFYRDQADILKDPTSSTVVEVTYKATANNLLRQDSSGKRHAQVHRKDCVIKYIPESDTTEIVTPLCRKPIRIYGINLNERNGWNLMVVRQEPGRSVDHHTPWLVEFKNTNNQYLLKLTDFGSRKNNRYGSSYTTSKAFG